MAADDAAPEVVLPDRVLVLFVVFFDRVPVVDFVGVAGDVERVGLLADPLDVDAVAVLAPDAARALDAGVARVGAREGDAVGERDVLAART